MSDKFIEFCVVFVVNCRGQAAVRLGAYRCENVVKAVVNVERDDVNARGEDALNGRFGKLQRGAYKLSALGIEAALLGHVLDDVINFVLRDGNLRVCLDKARGKIADRGQHGGKRSQNGHEKPQRARDR